MIKCLYIYKFGANEEEKFKVMTANKSLIKMIVDLILIKKENLKLIVQNTSFIGFVESSLSKHEAYPWRKDILWLLGIIYASSSDLAII